MATCAMPTVQNTKTVLAGLLGTSMEIGPASGGFTEVPAAVAVYNDDSGAAVALIACDIKFASYMGAALAMIPPEVAAESVTAGVLHEDLAENLHEIMNIAARFFNYADKSTHVSLSEMLVNGTPPPDSVMTLLANATQRMDLDADIPDYGSGRFTLIAM
jgi:hypothetical protein